MAALTSASTLGLLAQLEGNILHVYPDKLDPKGDVVTDLGGRFKYAWEVNQFGYSGTTFTAGLNFKF